jgi:hypothetical protein
MSRPAFAGSTPNDADEVIIAFIRISRATGRKLVCVWQFLACGTNQPPGRRSRLGPLR